LEDAANSMSRKLNITRRDFINGMAMSVAAGSALSPLELLARSPTPYPPALTGMRGSHAGSFEVAHGVAREGKRWPKPSALTDDVYDLVVVGGGISGLSAAFLYRQQAGNEARVLILDNHDDFGGHAKRNEFVVDGKTLIGYGGSQSIDTPGRYSPAAKQLLSDISIYPEHFYKYFDQDFYGSRELGRGVYFAAERFGRDSVHRDAVVTWGKGLGKETASVLDAYPMSTAARQSFLQLLTGPQDLLPDLELKRKATLMAGISYCDFLRKYGSVHEEVVVFLRDYWKSFWGVGHDVLSALEGARMGMPGVWDLEPKIDPSFMEEDEPYIFHFPDGNAGVARALVRQLIPAAMPGDSMEDLVTSRADYGQLDLARNATRIRLNSTAVDVRHSARGQAVDVTYVNDEGAYRVRARHAILACYNGIIPHICHETPVEQKEAIARAPKTPLVYINVALRGWKAFANLGHSYFYVPGDEIMHSFTLDFPVSMGGYQFAQSPEDPVVVHGTYCPTLPDQGLTHRQQNVAGRAILYEKSFDELEASIVKTMQGALGGGGFDAERDIAGITINRWPHGYAYEYNELFDPPDWNRKHGPHLVGAAQMGRISVANSDASAYAYVDGAIDAAVRAVGEQLETD
jgi:spermidine dehydrogenase